MNKSCFSNLDQRHVFLVGYYLGQILSIREHSCWDVTADSAKGSAGYLVLEIRYSILPTTQRHSHTLNRTSTPSSIVRSKLSRAKPFESIDRTWVRLYTSIQFILNLCDSTQFISLFLVIPISLITYLLNPNNTSMYDNFVRQLK